MIFPKETVWFCGLYNWKSWRHYDCLLISCEPDMRVLYTKLAKQQENIGTYVFRMSLYSKQAKVLEKKTIVVFCRLKRLWNGEVFSYVFIFALESQCSLVICWWSKHLNIFKVALLSVLWNLINPIWKHEKMKDKL